MNAIFCCTNFSMSPNSKNKFNKYPSEPSGSTSVRICLEQFQEVGTKLNFKRSLSSLDLLVFNYCIFNIIKFTNEMNICIYLKYLLLFVMSVFSSSSTILPFDSLKSRNRANNTAQWPVKTDGCLFVRSHFPRYHLPIVHYILECLGEFCNCTFKFDLQEFS